MIRRARVPAERSLAAVRLNARFTTAVSIPGQTRVSSAATTSSPVMSAVGTPNCAATVANISPSLTDWPASRTSRYSP